MTSRVKSEMFILHQYHMSFNFAIEIQHVHMSTKDAKFQADAFHETK